jgi:uncharacterized membrane protein
MFSFVLTDGLIAVASFVQYGRARMKEQPDSETWWLRIHYASMFILVVTGLIYMFYMVKTAS